MRKYKVDLLVYSPAKSPLAVVEIKNLKNLDPAAETVLVQQVLDYARGVNVRFLLLVSQDRGFLWDLHGESDGRQSPLCAFSMANVMRRYFPKHNPLQRVGHEELEFLVEYWLSELSSGVQGADEEPEESLAQTGFLAAMRGATVDSEVEVTV